MALRVPAKCEHAALARYDKVMCVASLDLNDLFRGSLTHASHRELAIFMVVWLLIWRHCMRLQCHSPVEVGVCTSSERAEDLLSRSVTRLPAVLHDVIAVVGRTGSVQIQDDSRRLSSLVICSILGAQSTVLALAPGVELVVYRESERVELTSAHIPHVLSLKGSHFFWFQHLLAGVAMPALVPLLVTPGVELAPLVALLADFSGDGERVILAASDVGHN